MAITKLNSLAIPPDTVVESDISFPLDSASFTGDLTVDTDTLVVDSTNNRVGIGSSDPAEILEIAAEDPVIRIKQTDSSLTSDQVLGGLEFESTDGSGSGVGVACSIKAVSKSTVGGRYGFDFGVASATSLNHIAMRIDPDGNLGVGSLPAPDKGRITVVGAGSAATNTPTGTTDSHLYLQDSSSPSGTSTNIDFGYDNRTSSTARIGAIQNTAVGTDMFFSTSNNYGAMCVERMRLDRNGNLLVGTTTANQRLTVEGANSSEGISVKNTSTVTNFNQALISLEYGTSRAGAGCYKNSNNTNPAGYIQLSDGNSSNFFFYHSAGVWRTSQTAGYIGTTTGTVVGSQTSDERIKTIESGFEYGLDSVMALTPIAYSFNDEQERRLGFGAQTTQAVVPEAVYDTGECIDGYDSCEENQMVQTARSSNTKLAMEYVQLIPVLTKAIQEQQAMIETLQAQVAELQGAN